MPNSKNILITGAGSGIGKGIAIFLASKGHHIIVTDLSLESASRTTAKIKIEGGSAQSLELDVTNQQHIDSINEKIDGNVDILINNAGLQHVEDLTTFPMEKWNFLVQVLLVSVARLSQAVIPQMREQNFGRIINIGSLHALVASPYKSAYVAAKHGLLGFSKTVALEVASNNITINTLCPAYVRTPLVEKQITSQAKEHGISEQQVVEQIMLKPMPKKAFISIEELAGSCEFLISDYAKNITAQAIALDGGWTAQ